MPRRYRNRQPFPRGKSETTHRQPGHWCPAKGYAQHFELEKWYFHQI